MKNKIFILLFLSLINSIFSQEAKPQTEVGAELFKKVDPSVVAIQIEKSGGSGMIISPDGYIITNGHVISDATRENPLRVSKRITVILSDETKYSAKYIGHSMDPDVALIKIEPKKPLSVVTFSDSTKVQTGQKCYALGMPVGHKRTLTSGIVSNTERILGTFTSIIQTDAAINPGNSGGPLFNEKGEVIGINTYAGGGQNLGFTIPANVVVTMKDHFLKFGYFKRAIVPFFFTANIYDELSDALGVSEGVLVDYVENNSIAYKAGMRSGDIIIEKNGVKVDARTHSQLLQFEWEMSTQEIGSDLQLKLKRKVNNEFVAIDFTAKMIEDELLPNIGFFQKGEIHELFYPELGLGVMPMVTVSRYINSITETQGVFVSQATPNFPAGRAGLIFGNSPDLITHINGIQISNLQNFEDILNRSLKDKQTYISLKIVRGKTTYETAIKPSYKLAGKSVAIILTAEEPNYWLDIIRFTTSTGINVEVFSKTGEILKIPSASPREKEIIIKQHENFDKLDVAKFDSLILIDGNKNMADIEPLLSKHLKDAINANKTIGAIGSTSLFLFNAHDSIKTKKITTNSANIEKALGIKANYTGKDVETDGQIITCTGADEDIVRAFLNKWKGLLKQ